LPSDQDIGALMARLMPLAHAHADGHFTILKFTTNWRVALNTRI
jgi:hypothetical protein